MSNKLYVGGLSWDTNEDGLRTAFEAFGEVRGVEVVTNRESGRSQGFGFVEMASSDGASSAIAGMQGTKLDGRTLRVSQAQEPKRNVF